MARARKQPAEAASEQADTLPKRRRHRGRRVLFWLMLLGGLAYALVRWQQQQVDVDEGVWHEAPEA